MKNELKNNLEFAEHYTTWVNKKNGTFNPILLEKSKEAIDELTVTKFPTKKDEEWRFTNIAPILKTDFAPADNNPTDANEIKDKINNVFLNDFDSYKLVFINGFFREDLSEIKSLPKNVFIGGLEKAVEEIPEIVKQYFGKSVKHNNAFELLNSAFTADGLFVYIPKNTTLKIPIEALFVSNNDENKMILPHNIVIAEENSEATILSNYSDFSDSVKLTNTLTEIYGAKSSRLTYIEIQSENNSSYRIGTTEIEIEESAVFNHFVLTDSGKLVRNNLNAELNGENIEAHFFGFYISKENRHIDNHTFIDHAKPNCFSNEIYKGILEDESKAVFGGRILVRKDSQKTNAFQSNKTILLSDKARIDTKPQLEIYADDVKCTHGATVGQLDKDALFYIVSRGISPERARSMLIKAFANDFLEPIKSDVVKENLNQKIFKAIGE